MEIHVLNFDFNMSILSKDSGLNIITCKSDIFLKYQNDPKKDLDLLYQTYQDWKFSKRNSTISLQISVNDWIPDSYSNTCMICCKMFNFISRRHHCRYCGSLICHACSVFIDNVRYCIECTL